MIAPENVISGVIIKLADEVMALPDPDSGKTKRALKGDQLEVLKLSLRTILADSLSILFSKSAHREASIHKATGYYTKSRYCTDLSYKIHIKRAYEGLCELGYLFETKAGVSNGPVGKYLTRYMATEKLTNLFDAEAFKALPVVLKKPKNMDSIRVTQKVKRKDAKTGKMVDVKVLVDYEDTKQTHLFRSNLAKINKVLEANWIDLEMSDDEIAEMQIIMQNDPEDEDTPPSISFNARALHRVFNDTDFTLGGRFYGGWWQGIPSKFRERILINGKRTCEVDYSTYHPTMLYLQEKLTPPDDPYSAVVRRLACPNEELGRKGIKQVFNAMLNAKQPMSQPPKHFDPKKYGLGSWKQASDAVLKEHKRIAHHFYSGVGLKLQRLDSDIAEIIMLHFADMNIPVLPVHDSFIVHSGYESALIEQMEIVYERIFKKLPLTKVDNFLSQRSEASRDIEREPVTAGDSLEYASTGHDYRLTLFKGWQ